MSIPAKEFIRMRVEDINWTPAKETTSKHCSMESLGEEVENHPLGMPHPLPLKTWDEVAAHKARRLKPTGHGPKGQPIYAHEDVKKLKLVLPDQA